MKKGIYVKIIIFFFNTLFISGMKIPTHLEISNDEICSIEHEPILMRYDLTSKDNKKRRANKLFLLFRNHKRATMTNYIKNKKKFAALQQQYAQDYSQATVSSNVTPLKIVPYEVHETQKPLTRESPADQLDQIQCRERSDSPPIQAHYKKTEKETVDQPRQLTKTPKTTVKRDATKGSQSCFPCTPFFRDAKICIIL